MTRQERAQQEPRIRKYPGEAAGAEEHVGFLKHWLDYSLFSSVYWLETTYCTLSRWIGSVGCLAHNRHTSNVSTKSRYENSL